MFLSCKNTCAGKVKKPNSGCEGDTVSKRVKISAYIGKIFITIMRKIFRKQMVLT